jgi:hypothetical protein
MKLDGVLLSKHMYKPTPKNISNDQSRLALLHSQQLAAPRSLPIYTVFFHCPQTPNKLLVTPASPTTPSSSSTHPSAELGIVISHTSLMSCTNTASSSLATFFVSTTFSGSDEVVSALARRERL